jgi:hypothetical protein
MSESIEIPKGLTQEDFTQWYREIYLHSPHWLGVRTQALDWWEHQCGQCGGNRSLVVHHPDEAQWWELQIAEWVDNIY